MNTMRIIDIEKALIKRYRNVLWRPFIRAITEFDLIQANDKIAVCISGGKDSLLLAKLFQELHRHGQYKFELEFIAMNPGYSEENLQALKENAEKLDIPLIIRDSNIFEAAEKMNRDYPCYLCARMRRGFLYQFAKDLGCNKIALAHHFNDVIETTLLNVLYGGTFSTMLPKLKATNFEGMELIRPMVYIKEANIIKWIKFTKLNAMACGCRVTQENLPSKRTEMKELIANLKQIHDNVDISIFRSAQNVNMNTILGWQKDGKKESFLDYYEESQNIDDE